MADRSRPHDDPTSSWKDTGDMPASPPPPPVESVIDDLQKPIVDAFSGEDVTARASARPAAPPAAAAAPPVEFISVGHAADDIDIIRDPPASSAAQGEPPPSAPPEPPPSPPPVPSYWDLGGGRRLAPMTGDRETSIPPEFLEWPFGERSPRREDGLDRIGRGDEGSDEGSDDEGSDDEGSDSGLEIPTISVPEAIPPDESDPFDWGRPAPPAVTIPRPSDLIGTIRAFSPLTALVLVAMLIMAGAGWALTRPADVAPVPAPNANAPAGSAAPAATAPAAAGAVQPATPTARRTTAASYHVTGLPATYSGTCRDLIVTWAWIIDGLGDSGNYMIRHQRRDGDVIESGPFILRPSTTGAQTWDPATGRLELVEHNGGQMLRVEITLVRGRPVTGDAASNWPGPPPC